MNVSKVNHSRQNIDRIAKLLRLPFGMKTGRHYVDKYLLRGVDRDRMTESRWIPPYDDPLY